MNHCRVGAIRRLAAKACAAAFFILARTASAEATKEAAMEYTAQTGISLWSTTSVLELYKMAGWQMLDVRRIWANKDWPHGNPQTRHNAFTDLAYFKGHWYCVFRVGEDHGVTGPLGGLRVIRSRDGENWTSVFFHQAEEPSVDVRDSKFVVIDDKQIMVLGHENYRFEPARTRFKDRGIRRSMTWLSSDGEQWEGPYASGADNTWIWSGAWHKGVGYGIAYSEKEARDPGGAIYRTTDGKHWERLATDIFPTNSQGVHQGNEASVVFDADDGAWMYLRDTPHLGGGKFPNVGYSKPPYTEWDWTRTTPINLGGPKMIRLSDGRLVVVGRIWGRHGAYGYGDSHTAIYELDLQSNVVRKIAVLPSQGDNAYPGVVEKDGELWISYYSCHEDPNPENRRPHLQRSCIYLVRLKIGGPAFIYPPTDRHFLNPVPPPAPAAPAPMTQPPPDASFREAFQIDLAPFVNRALADEVADDGEGGWSDQGPDCDMREVKTGKRIFGGVPFDILPGKSLVVLSSMNRPSGSLPDAVTIPCGRKVDGLFFLHSAAYFDGAFHYVLHYADGQEVTLTLDDRNMRDWVDEPSNVVLQAEGVTTVVAETVPSPKFGKGSLYRTGWNAPPDRRDVELKSIEFRGDGKVVPILAAITGIIR